MDDPIFEPPISTSNLYAPQLSSIHRTISSTMIPSAVNQSNSLIEELEWRLCVYHDCRYCVTFATGFWALVAAIEQKAIVGRHEAIIPSLTYRRLADVVHWAGMMPAMVDIEPENLSICPQAVEDAISTDTALILAVHPIVNCCDVEQLIEIADRNQVPIVFDAVESVHETLKGKRIGSFGPGEVFSLHASKLLNGCEGGYVCTDDENLFIRLKVTRDQQVTTTNLATDIASPTVTYDALNQLHAALAIASLDEIEINVSHNRSIYLEYLNELDPRTGIHIRKFHEHEQTSYKNIVASVQPPFPISRDQLVSELNRRGILARAYYSPALHEKQHGFPVKVGSMKITDRFKDSLINLPCGSRVNKRDVKLVCRYLHEIAGI